MILIKAPAGTKVPLIFVEAIFDSRPNVNAECWKPKQKII